MVDIATIGFAADTSGLNQATTALNQLTPAANKAAAAAANTAGALQATSQAGTKVSAAAAGLSAANNNVSKTAAGVTTSYQMNKRMIDDYLKSLRNTQAGMQGVSWEAKNLSFQLVDVAQGVASGISPFQIFAQQAGQIGQVIATSPGGLGGLMKELGKAVAGVLTPMRLLTLGFAGATVGAIAFGISTLNSSKSMDELSKSTNFAMKDLHAIEQLTSAKGISKDDFASGMKSFAEQVYLAKQNVGDLNGLMIANGQTAKTNVQYFMRVADLVARTRDEVQKRKILEAAGLPAPREWVELMSQGSKAIKLAADGTVQFNVSAEANLVRKAREFDDAWNKATTNVSNYLKSSMLSIMEKIANFQVPDWMKTIGKAALNTLPGGSLISGAMSAVNLTKGAPSFDDRFGPSDRPGNSASLEAALQKRITDARKPDPKTQAQLLVENQQSQARINILGDLATVEDRVKQKQLELNAAGLQGVGVSDIMAQKILNATRAQEEMNRVNQQASLGIFNMAAAQKAATDTLQMWIDKGLVNKNNTQEMAAAQEVLKRNIEQTANAAQIAAAPLQGLKQLQLDASNFSKQLDQTLVSSLNNLVSPIQDVLNGVTSLKDGFKNAGVIILKAIQEMIIKMLILAPIAKGLQAIFSGFGGPAAALASGIAPVAKGAYFGANDNVKQFSKGDIFNRPTLFSYASGSMFGEMGEAGPEAVMPLKRSPNGSLGVQMYGNNRGGDKTSVVFAPVYHVGGNVTQDDIQQIKRAAEQERKSFVSKVAAAIPEARKRGARI